MLLYKNLFPGLTNLFRLTIMARPTQDMDISSSIISNDNLLINSSSSNKYYDLNVLQEV